MSGKRTDETRRAEEGERVEEYERKFSRLPKKERAQQSRDALRRRLDRENPQK